jgi:N-acetylglutamate synthase-like GNAT family acetyltransferase
MTPSYQIRNAKPEEFAEISQLMIKTFEQQEGFPKRHEQPDYYHLLANIGDFIKKSNSELLVAVTPDHKIMGTVVYFDKMEFYGSGGIATQEVNTSSFRLLSVDDAARGKGVGKQLVLVCIEKARQHQAKQLVIHTTKSMQTAWKLYEALGFYRSEDLDFPMGDLIIYGFRLKL